MIDQPIIGVVLAVAGLYALCAMWTEWRGTGGADPFAPPEWWPGDLPLWRALIRAGPIGAVEGAFVAGGFLTSTLESSAVTSALEVVFQVFVVVTVALIVLVGLFNRPRAIVPPRFRDYPGALDEWRGAPVTEPIEGGSDGATGSDHLRDRNPDRPRDRDQHRAPQQLSPSRGSRWAPWWAYVVPIVALNYLRQVLVPPSETGDFLAVVLFATVTLATVAVATVVHRRA